MSKSDEKKEYSWIRMSKVGTAIGQRLQCTSCIIFIHRLYGEEKKREKNNLGKIHWNNKSCSNRTANKGNEIMLNEKSRVRCWSRLKNTIFYSFECPTKTTAKKLFLRWRSSFVLHSSPKLNKGDVSSAWKCENIRNIATYQHNTRTILT